MDRVLNTVAMMPLISASELAVVCGINARQSYRALDSMASDGVVEGVSHRLAGVSAERWRLTATGVEQFAERKGMTVRGALRDWPLSAQWERSPAQAASHCWSVLSHRRGGSARRSGLSRLALGTLGRLRRLHDARERSHLWDLQNGSFTERQIHRQQGEVVGCPQLPRLYRFRRRHHPRADRAEQPGRPPGAHLYEPGDRY